MFVDCFLLADSAQEVNGKLYVLGGGWNQISAAAVPVVHPVMSLAVRVCVPWIEANNKLHLEIRLEDEDGNDVIPEPITSELTVGRPATVPPGSDLVVPFAITLHNLELSKFGAYRFILTADGYEHARSIFHLNRAV